MMKKRLGKFYVSTELVMTGDVLPVLTSMQFIPTRVEHLYHMGKFEYIGMSPIFPELGEGFMIPEYDVQLSKDDIGNVTVTTQSL